MKVNMHLWQGQRSRYIKELSVIYELFTERIYPVFENAEEDAQAFQNEKWEDFMQRPVSEDCDIDPGDYVDDFIDIGYERFEILSLMRYRTLVMWISCLCQIWEQQLFKLIIDESEHHNSGFTLKTRAVDFGKVKEVYSKFGFDFETLAYWSKIDELRELVNTVKHGEGRAANKLRNYRSDFFDMGCSSLSSFGNAGNDTLNFNGSTLLEETLNISTNDFKQYLDALIAFWNDIPEHMTLV